MIKYEVRVVYECTNDSWSWDSDVLDTFGYVVHLFNNAEDNGVDLMRYSDTQRQNAVEYAYALYHIMDPTETKLIIE